MKQACVVPAVLCVLVSGCLLLRPGTPQRGGGTQPGAARLTATFGDVVTQGGRLYYSVWLKGEPLSAYEARRQGSVPTKVVLGGPDTAAEVVFTDVVQGAPVCEGVAVDTRDNTTDLKADCSFDIAAPQPGDYTLELHHRGQVVATREVTLVTVRDSGGERVVVVDPGSRARTVRIDWKTPVYWHEMDVTDPKSVISFAWFEDGHLVADDWGTAKGPELEYTGLIVDVVGVRGMPPPGFTPGTSTPYRLVVVKDAAEVLGAFDMPANHPNHTLLLPSTARPDELAAARVAASRHLEESRHSHLEHLDKTWPEPLACAVISKGDARKAFNEMRRERNDAHWAWYDGAVAHDTALDVSDPKLRAALKGRMVSKMKQRAAHKSAEGGAQETLRRASRDQRPGCLRALSRI